MAKALAETLTLALTVTRILSWAQHRIPEDVVCCRGRPLGVRQGKVLRVGNQPCYNPCLARMRPCFNQLIRVFCVPHNVLNTDILRY